MLVLDSPETKNSSLARLCDTARCNFAREHGIGGLVGIGGVFPDFG